MIAKALFTERHTFLALARRPEGDRFRQARPPSRGPPSVAFFPAGDRLLVGPDIYAVNGWIKQGVLGGNPIPSVVALAPVVQSDGSTKRYHIRGVIVDPADPTTVYVATYGDSVWKVTAATSEPPTKKRRGGPATFGKRTSFSDMSISPHSRPMAIAHDVLINVLM